MSNTSGTAAEESRSESPGRVLAIVDADRIHDYVFSPRSLKLIRGGSGLQAQLNLEVLVEDLSQASGSRLIYAGGGTILASFEETLAAADYCRKAQSRFREATHAATASWAVSEPKGDFSEQLASVRKRLEAHKTGLQERRQPVSSTPFSKCCEACGLFAASQLQALADGGSAYYCAACAARSEASQQLRYFGKVKGKLSEQGTPCPGLAPPRDFEALGEMAKPLGYVAVLYIDGDRLGKFLDEHAKTDNKFELWSNRIRDGMESAILGAAASLCDADTGVAPFEILLLGGDDAVVVVAAQFAVPFLEAFDQAIQAIQPEQGTRFGYSAGIVFCHSHFPIADGIERAEECLRSAKREGGGRIDFEVITGASADEFNEGAKNATLRPYPIDELFKLAAAIRSLKESGAPRNKVTRLYELAFEQRDQAQLEYCYLLSRLSPEHKIEFGRIFPEGFWRSNNRTAGADVAQLWEFVGI